MEIEENNSLAFLDSLVKRSKTIAITVYRKRSFTGIYLNWYSLTSRKFKLNLVKCLLDRAWKICTSYELFHKEVQNLKYLLCKNDYPIEIVDNIIEKFIEKKYAPKNNINDKTNQTQEHIKDKKKIHVCLPYYNSLVEDFGPKLKHLVEKYYPNVQCNVSFKAPRTLKSLFNFKDQISKTFKSLVVYKINCSCGASEKLNAIYSSV